MTELERWIVRDNVGNVVARFATQIKAIDFANREQKKQPSIVLIDVTRCEVQMIARTNRQERVG
ncbi:MAG TPA: hypothetical protein V6C89_03785 [Drouetiella sp.]